MAEGRRDPMGPPDANTAEPAMIGLGTGAPQTDASRPKRQRFSADELEQTVQLVSRLAGPVILFLVLSAIMYLIYRAWI